MYYFFNILVFIIGGINAYSYQYEGSILSTMLLLGSFSYYIYGQLGLNSLKRAFLYGFLFGLGQFTVGLYWIVGILGDYYSNNVLYLVLTLIGIIIFLSLFNAFSCACLYLLLRKQKTVFKLFLPPTLLVFTDWIRELGDMGFPWLQPNVFFIDSFASGWYPLIGGLGVNFLLYFLITFCVILLSQRCRLSFYLKVSTSVACIIFITPFISDTSWTTTQPSLSTRILHGSFSNREKLSRNETIERFDKFTSLSLQYPKSDLVVWPESSMSFPYQIIDKFIEPSLESLLKNNTSVIYGASWYKDTEIINVLMHSGQNKPIYTKQKLVPFGEYRPQWFRYLFESIPLSRGDEMSSLRQYQPPLNLNGSKVIFAICFEALFSTTYSEQLLQNDAGLVVLISDLEWSPNKWIQKYLLSISRVRAMEIERSMLYSTNHGISAIINRQGTILVQSSNEKRTQRLDSSITPTLGLTPYASWGHKPLVIFIIIIIASAIFNQSISSIKGKKISQGAENII